MVQYNLKKIHIVIWKTLILDEVLLLVLIAASIKANVYMIVGHVKLHCYT